MAIKINVLASGSSGNAYVVEGGRYRLLIECGISAKEIAKRSGFVNFDAVFVSHDHKDHSKSVKEMLTFGIPVYMPPEMSAQYQHHNAISLKDKGQFLISHNGDCDIFTFELHHDVQTFGFMVKVNGERLVYVTDTLYCHYKFPKVTHWMVECNMSRDILDESVAAGIVHPKLRDRIVSNHMDLNTVKEMLLANDLSYTQEIWLLHLSNDNSDAERFRREVAEITGKVVYTT